MAPNFSRSRPAAIFLSLVFLIALIAPAPFAIIAPGPATNLLGNIVTVTNSSGIALNEPSGKLFSTSVYVNSPERRSPGVQILWAWIAGKEVVVPWSAVYPPGQSGKAAKQNADKEMRSSQEKATLAAANFLKSLNPNQPLGWKPADIKIALHHVGGPSAGLAFALALVAKLKAPELIGGRRIAVTGEITETGKVGPIGGIDQKMIGAKSAGAEIFILPKETCQDITRTPKGLKLIAVISLGQAVHALADSKIADSLHC